VLNAFSRLIVLRFGGC